MRGPPSFVFIYVVTLRPRVNPAQLDKCLAVLHWNGRMCSEPAGCALVKHLVVALVILLVWMWVEVRRSRLRQRQEDGRASHPSDSAPACARQLPEPWLCFFWTFCIVQIFLNSISFNINYWRNPREMIRIPRHASGAPKVHEFWTVHLSWMLILELVHRKKWKERQGFYWLWIFLQNQKDVHIKWLLLLTIWVKLCSMIK